MSIDLTQFIPTFLDESFEGLQLMETSLLSLEQGDNDTIHAIFRAAHSIKGGAGTFGFHRVTDFTHEVETLLDEMRDGRRQICQSDTDLLLKSVDCIRLLIEASRDGIECIDRSIDEVHQALELALNGQSDDGDVNNPSDNMTDQSDASIPSDITPKNGKKQWQIKFMPNHEMLHTGNDPVHIFYALSELGQVDQIIDVSHLPPLNELQPEECYFSWQLTLTSDCGNEQIAEVFEWVEDDCKIVITQKLVPETSSDIVNVDHFED